MPRRPQAKGTGDGGHEPDDAHEEGQEDDDDAEAAPAPSSPSPPTPAPQAPSPPAAPPPQTAGDTMMNLLKQVPHKITCFDGDNRGACL